MFNYTLPANILEKSKERAMYDGNIMFKQIKLEPIFINTTFYTTRSDGKVTRHVSDESYHVFVTSLKKKLSEMLGEEPYIAEQFPPFFLIKDNIPYKVIVIPFVWKDTKNKYQLKFEIYKWRE